MADLLHKLQQTLGLIPRSVLTSGLVGLAAFLGAIATYRPKRVLMSVDDPRVANARKLLHDHMQRLLPGARIFTTGPTNFLVATMTNGERDRLARDRAIQRVFRNILRAAAYSRQSIADARLVFESQETVDESTGGDWRLFLK